MNFELTRGILDTGTFASECPELLYKSDMSSSCFYDSNDAVLVVSGFADFTTYFNSISVAKWKEYAGINSISLKISMRGDAATLAIVSLGDAEGYRSDVFSLLDVPASDGFSEYEAEIPMDAIVAGFGVLTDGVVEISEFSYIGHRDEPIAVEPKLALVTTTFQKEDYILPNIDIAKKSIFADSEWAGRFHMFVIDNGRDLDAVEISDEHVTVIPNDNTGGSGGFARGMIAAMDDGSFSHVLLMDDDVKMSPESFKRTWTLLALARDEWSDACVNGAMLELERPFMQFEDIAYAKLGGGYRKVKPDFDMRSAKNLYNNETFVIDDMRSTYGAWWYSCIPMDAVREAGLPMPFFVRCDDVEYGVRIKRKYMTMNGIGIWHAGFDGRFRPAVDCYQYVRNMLATMSLHDGFDMPMFRMKYCRTFDLLLRKMDYASAELWLDGLEDYMQGPHLLISKGGLELMSEHAKKSEKMIPLEENPVLAGLSYDSSWLMPNERSRNTLVQVIKSIPHDRHWLPAQFLRNKIGVTIPGPESFTPWTETAMTHQLAVVSPDGKTGCLRTVDYNEYIRLRIRCKVLVTRWRSNQDKLTMKWRNAAAHLSSRDFWDDYLGLSLQQNSSN